MKTITPRDCVIRVSSTLDSSSGKKNLLDGSDETCWSSAQGLPQTIHLNWKELIPATHFALTFQGGFSATAVSTYVAAERPGRSNGDVALGMAFGGKVYPKDGNGRQVFEIPMPEALPDSVHDEEHPLSPTPLSSKPVHAVNPKDDREWIREIKLEFEKSADPWGRIVVYHFELLEEE